jgi:hypothetical protein
MIISMISGGISNFVATEAAMAQCRILVVVNDPSLMALE